MMNNEIPIKIQPPVNTGGTPETYLRQKDFDALVYAKGYPTYIDYMMPCPCKEEGVNSPKLTCKNCYGTGFVLVDRVMSQAMFAQMNFPTEYKDWSIENIGTVSITTLSSNVVGFMDRLILYQEESVYSELIYPIQTENNDVIAFCSYPPINILNIKLFQGDTEKLLDIDKSKIKIDEEGRLILTEIQDILYKRPTYVYNDKSAISIRYTYHPSYHVVDVTRNVIISPTDTSTNGLGSKGQRVQFPYHAIGRMSHLVLERGNLFSLPKDYNLNVSGSSTSMLEQMNQQDVDEIFCKTENRLPNVFIFDKSLLNVDYLK